MTSAKYEQQIYYGEKTTTYSIVGGPQKEIDYSERQRREDHQLQGQERGQPLQPRSTGPRARWRSTRPQILYSGAIGEGSRILYNRTPKERVEAVAPWLTIDGDAYPAVVDGHIQWIVDAYTHPSNGYPYASRTTLRGHHGQDFVSPRPTTTRRGGGPAEPGQLHHPQLGEGDRRRVHR
ncbi:UPF0182 family protein [Streptomyces sp. L7]